MIARALATWCLLLVVAVINGSFRIAVLNPRLGERSGHVASTILLCLLILLVCWMLIEWISPASVGHALMIGALWIALTMVFEFGFGRLIAGKSWPELLDAYDIAAGRVWILVLITTLFAPLLSGRARKAW